jgi:hypothetical protein
MEEITLVSGKVLKGYSSDQTWGLWLTPTGYEKPLKQAPLMFLARRSIDASCTEVRYEVVESFIIRIINIHTSFGKPTKVAKVDIKIDSEAEKLEITTPSGAFLGRGEIVKEHGRKLDIKVIEMSKKKTKKHMNLIK